MTAAAAFRREINQLRGPREKTGKGQSSLQVTFSRDFFHVFVLGLHVPAIG
jgi:hypothetical protein